MSHVPVDFSVQFGMVEELQIKNQELQTKVKYLESANEAIQIKHIDLSHQVNLLVNRLNEIDTLKLFNKFKIAIQDANSQDDIERFLVSNPKAKRSLMKLRKSCVSSWHYLNETVDTPDEILQKRTLLLDKINTMDIKVQQLFNKHYPDLLNEIKSHIASTRITPSDDIVEEVNNWWDDY